MEKDDKILSMSHEDRVFNPPFQERVRIKSPEEYEEQYKKSIEDPEGFWAERALELDWFEKWHTTFRYTEYPFVKWFEGGKLNVCYNCIDRHLKGPRKNKAAIIWQGEKYEDYRTLTFQELHYEVCRFANVLKKKGVAKGDRVCLYMPMIPELAIAMLACARIGAIHSIVFGGFSAESLKKRLIDSEAKVLITADGGFRKGKAVPLKNSADEALKGVKTVSSVVVVQRTKEKIKMKKNRDFWWHEELEKKDITPFCDAEVMDAEDSLFILYTSGTTGTPKGILHTTGGYLTYVHNTFKDIFDIRDDDVYWCTADIGWITGHSYIVYGPLSNGATTMMFEGVPNYPEADRAWRLVERYGISVFYTAPTAIRALIKEGNEWPDRRNLSSLRILGSVGEPINPEAWMWYYDVIGKGKCPIVDTWWQTETGGIMITPLPGITPLKPGSATRPYFGIKPKVLREDGTEADVNEGGYLVIEKPWPSMGRTVWGNPERYKEVYYSKFPGYYFAGDSARKDEDGFFWIMGRIDDVLNVAGHRIGTAEIESALVSHKAVAEAAVVSMPHPIKGEGIFAYVTLNKGAKGNDALVDELRATVAKEIGPIAKPDRIHFTDSLPKTRSGKIMRRILKAIAAGKEVGDTTTLADPSVVTQLVKDVNMK